MKDNTLRKTLADAVYPQDDLGREAKEFVDKALESANSVEEFRKVTDRIRAGEGTDLDWRINEMMVDTFIAVSHGIAPEIK